MIRMTKQEKREQFCSAKFPTQLDFARLGADIDGKIAWPDASYNYSAYNFQHNMRTYEFPAVHVLVHSAEDIRKAIKFAKDHHLHVTIKSSGHDYLGRSSAHDSFSINLMEMKGMTVTPDRTDRSEYGELKVETGNTWKEIYQELDKYKRVVAGGSAHMVSPGGYTLGGGHGPLSPSIGLAVDNLLEIQVVLADGRITTCTETQSVHEYPDGTTETEENGNLFWAMRGGGGGTFGIVVYYVFKLHPDPEAMVLVAIGMPFYAETDSYDVATKFFDKYNKWTLRVPDYWGGYILFNNFPVREPTYNLTGTIFVYLNKFGPWDGNTTDELKEFYELQDELPPQYLVPFTVTNKTSFWDYEKDATDAYMVRAYTMGSLIPPENHNTSLTEFFIKEFKSDDYVPLHCTLIRLGGAVKEFPVNSSSVHAGFRSAQTCASCSIQLDLAPGFSKEAVKVLEDQEEFKNKSEQFAKDLRMFGNGEYLNEGDADNPNWKYDFWGDHYVDLLRVKIRYDPENLFSCHHCVGSDYGSFSVTDASVATRAGFLTVLVMSLVVLLM